jgi:hypothetical protein
MCVWIRATNEDLWAIYEVTNPRQIKHEIQEHLDRLLSTSG